MSKSKKRKRKPFRCAIAEKHWGNSYKCDKQCPHCRLTLRKLNGHL